MLEEPREIPDFVITKYEVGDDVYFTIPHDLRMKHVKEDLTSGGYDLMDNVIYISAYNEPLPRDLQRDMEDAVLKTVLHETDHWAQFLFVDANESVKILANYNKYRAVVDDTIPIFEKHNFFKSTYWSLREMGYMVEIQKRLVMTVNKKLTYNFISSMLMWSVALLNSYVCFTSVSILNAIVAGIFYALGAIKIGKWWDESINYEIKDRSYWYPPDLNSTISVLDVKSVTNEG